MSTVQTHLSRAHTKLGISSRAELPPALRALDGEQESLAPLAAPPHPVTFADAAGSARAETDEAVQARLAQDAGRVGAGQGDRG